MLFLATLLTPLFCKWFGITDISHLEILLPIHILWINLVTDSLPAIALGMEEADKDIMHKKPHSSRKSLFADGLWSKIILEGTMIGVLTLVAYSIGIKMYNLTIARTMVFTSLSILELLHSINVRTDKSIFTINPFKNMYLVGAIISGIILQVVVTSLNNSQWLIVWCISIMPIIIVELQKRLNEIKYGKTIFAKEDI